MTTKQQPNKQAEQPAKPAAATYKIPRLTEITDPATVIRNVLKKCLSTLNEDIDALAPKDRIMLWKEYNSYFEEVRGNSDIPGMNIRNIEVTILNDNQNASY
jgi:hypothetical protein